MRYISVAALNIVLPRPHSPDRYRKLWLDAFDAQSPMKLRGDVGGLVGSALTPRGKDFITGEFLKFVNIDAMGRWLDVATLEAAPREDVEKKVVIPPTYRPNLHSLPYLFFPKQHRLLFISRLDQRNTLSPLMAKVLVEQFLTRTQLVRDHGEATVNVEPDRETLQRIFALPTLKEIILEVSPPNALGDVERELIEFMAEQNATKYVQQFTTDLPGGLHLTEHTKLAAEVAQSNGHVSARGVNEDGQVVKLSTESHPFEEKIAYEPKISTVGDVFEGVAVAILHELAKPINRRN